MLRQLFIILSVLATGCTSSKTHMITPQKETRVKKHAATVHTSPQKKAQERFPAFTSTKTFGPDVEQLDLRMVRIDNETYRLAPKYLPLRTRMHLFQRTPHSSWKPILSFSTDGWGRSKELNNLRLHLENQSPGDWAEFAIITDDASTGVRQRINTNPITCRGKGRLHLELMHGGDETTYVLRARGCLPEERLYCVVISDSEPFECRFRADKKGEVYGPLVPRVGVKLLGKDAKLRVERSFTGEVVYMNYPIGSHRKQAAL